MLEKTFIINAITPFFKNAKKEVVKSPKIYFSDLGFLNIAQGIIPSLNQTISGSIFENACFLRLLEINTYEKPQFWRTKSGGEVDFVITSAAGKNIPIEIKLNRSKTLKKGFWSFLKKYNPDKAFVYFLKHGQKNRTATKNPIVHYIPYHVLPDLGIRP